MGENWLYACQAEAVSEGEAQAVDVGGREIALYMIAGQVYATANVCTHGQARLSDGYLEGYTIECPLHQGRFDIRSGAALCAPVSIDVKTYAAKREGECILIDLLERQEESHGPGAGSRGRAQT